MSLSNLLDPNDHAQAAVGEADHIHAGSAPDPQIISNQVSELERKILSAVSQSDYEQPQELNEQLATLKAQQSPNPAPAAPEAAPKGAAPAPAAPEAAPEGAAPEAAAPEGGCTKLRDNSIKLRDDCIKLVQLVLQLVFVEARIADPKEGHKLLVKVATANAPRVCT